MGRDPYRLVAEVTRELAPGADANRLVPAVAAGTAPIGVLAELAAQEYRIVTSDRRSLLVLAARCADSPAGAFFAESAAGESRALELLGGFGERCGLPRRELVEREPLPGCQAYPAYLAWLALNGDPAGVIVALAANFAAWGGYCATIASGLRRHYGFDDRACAFFDHFATPPAGDGQPPGGQVEGGGAEDPVAAALATLDLAAAGTAGREYGRLLQAYELMFWSTLADLPAGGRDGRDSDH
ncbi:transcriptional regulator [Kitasatospora sp. NPDC059571]|uniref:transcriptional regulator n=1 Tax=Kitasatospora sp. NPDC059571 TaxID=3346871 RepID=UPI0036CCD7FD